MFAWMCMRLYGCGFLCARIWIRMCACTRVGEHVHKWRCRCLWGLIVMKMNLAEYVYAYVCVCSWHIQDRMYMHTRWWMHIYLKMRTIKTRRAWIRRGFQIQKLHGCTCVCTCLHVCANECTCTWACAHGILCRCMFWIFKSIVNIVIWMWAYRFRHICTCCTCMRTELHEH